MHVIVTRGGLLPGYGDSFTHLSCILAAAAHDVEHYGLTNDFLVASQDDLAVLYNDKSPLENHHASRLFSLLKRPELNLLSHMPTKVGVLFCVVGAGITCESTLSAVTHVDFFRRLNICVIRGLA